MNCENRTCQLQINTIEMLRQEEKKLHLAEINKIQESLRGFTRARNQEAGELRDGMEKLGMKVEKYKRKCCSLNDKIKEQIQTIKVLNKRVALLEESLQGSKDQYNKQKSSVIEQLRVGSELRQIIDLQETQNKQLRLKIQFCEKQIQNLQYQLASKIDAESKLKNVEYVSQQQYQRQIELLRQNLKLEFNKSANELLSTLSSGSACDFTETKVKKDEPEISEVEGELNLLANMMEYGAAFDFVTSNKGLQFEASRRIQGYWQSTLNKISQLQQQNEDLRIIKEQLTQEMKHKLDDIESLVTIHNTPTLQTGTQTPQNQNLQQLISTNGIYRIKLIQMQEIMTLVVHFAAFIINLKGYTQNKINYYRKVAVGKVKVAEGKGRNRFRMAALSIFFIQVLKKKARMGKRNKYSMQESKIFGSRHLKFENLFLKCLNQKQKYSRKNPILEKLMRQKSKISGDQIISTVINMISEQTVGLTLSKVHSISQDVFNCNYC